MNQLFTFNGLKINRSFIKHLTRGSYSDSSKTLSISVTLADDTTIPASFNCDTLSAANDIWSSFSGADIINITSGSTEIKVFTSKLKKVTKDDLAGNPGYFVFNFVFESGNNLVSSGTLAQYNAL